jgi:hypothetical protein
MSSSRNYATVGKMKLVDVGETTAPFSAQCVGSLAVRPGRGASNFFPNAREMMWE